MVEDSRNPNLSDLLLHRVFADRPREHRSLLEAFGDAQQVLSATSRALESAGMDRKVTARLNQAGREQSRARQDLKWFQDERRGAISILDAAYPESLRTTPDPPCVLYYDGDFSVLTRPSVAVVGSRAATPAGLEAAALFARELGQAGLVIVSGMALGIDAHAQRACIVAGGQTVAVFGTGCDVVHPQRHLNLSREIAANGLLLSEFPLGTRPFPGNFPRRNRVISGLTLGTLVVEAAERSGTLITARFAAEQGREVFVVPGSIFSRRSEGCHALIREGAALVRAPGDVLAELGFAPHVTVKASRTLPVAESRLLECLGDGPLTLDQLSAASGVAPQALAASLTELEISGHVKSLGGTYMRVRV